MTFPSTFNPPSEHLHYSASSMFFDNGYQAQSDSASICCLLVSFLQWTVKKNVLSVCCLCSGCDCTASLSNFQIVVQVPGSVVFSSFSSLLTLFPALMSLCALFTFDLRFSQDAVECNRIQSHTVCLMCLGWF